MSTDPHEKNLPTGDSEAHKSKTLDAAGWGALLVWLGITMLLALSWPTFLIGLGALVLAMQAMRARWNLKMEAFWLILGVVFIVAGITERYGTGLPLVPIALIAFGIAALYGVYKRINEHHG